MKNYIPQCLRTKSQGRFYEEITHYCMIEYRCRISSLNLCFPLKLSGLNSYFQNSVLFILKKNPVLWCDNNNTHHFAQNLVFHSRTKHIEVDIHFIRNKVATGLLEVKYVNITDQLADILTKLLTTTRTTFLIFKLNLTPTPVFSLDGDVRDS